jgi:isopentenyl diphosphate isomerase/L-lactate dehydrogenase-like FMN-dependent dehydrogenase
MSMSDQKLNRRQALGSVGAIVAGTVAGSAVGRGQAPAAQQPTAGADMSPARRLAPREELVNALEFEEEAKKKLPPAVFATIAGGDRALFERITLRPRMLHPTIDMDLTVNLFGHDHFTPIMIAPISEQKRFHPEGEIATATAAAATNALMIMSSRSSTPLDQIVAAAKAPFWYQVYASESMAKPLAQEAVKIGAQALVVTVGASPNGNRVAAPASINWNAVDGIRQSVSVPVIVKGITTPAEANAAVQRGAQGIIVSNFGGMMTNKDAMILTLPSIIDAVAGKVPVLTDGAFRRGTDIIKALAFGAQGVLIGRPVMWGLAAYGEPGVRSVVEMLQTELGRYMAMCGKVNLKALDRTAVKVHGPAPAKTTGTNN